MDNFEEGLEDFKKKWPRTNSKTTFVNEEHAQHVVNLVLELIRCYHKRTKALEEIIKLGQESSEEFSLAYQALEIKDA